MIMVIVSHSFSLTRNLAKKVSKYVLRRDNGIPTSKNLPTNIRRPRPVMWRVPEVLPASMVPEGVHHVVGSDLNDICPWM